MKQKSRIRVDAAHAGERRAASLLIAFATAVSAVGDQSIRVACVGDSITFGQGIAEREKNSYPAQLARLLGENYDVRNFGRSGAAAFKRSDRPYWTQPEFVAAREFAPEVVLLMLGIAERIAEEINELSVSAEASASSRSPSPRDPRD